MVSKPPNASDYRPWKGPCVLESVPPCMADLPDWLDSLEDRAFDSVWVSAITLTLHDDQTETAFVSVGKVANLLVDVRKRYRRIIAESSLNPNLRLTG